MPYKNTDKMIRVWISQSSHKKVKNLAVLLEKPLLDTFDKVISEGIDLLITKS